MHIVLFAGERFRYILATSHQDILMAWSGYAQIAMRSISFRDWRKPNTALEPL